LCPFEAVPDNSTKKTKSFGLRFAPDLRADLDEAAKASGLNSPEALRIAAEAMVAAYRKVGRIPRDMEIRQAIIGDAADLASLVERLQAVAESQSPYLTNNKKPPKPASREASTGPVALVSDRPA
jgi:hypothetical protein